MRTAAVAERSRLRQLAARMHRAIECDAGVSLRVVKRGGVERPPNIVEAARQQHVAVWEGGRHHEIGRVGQAAVEMG